MWLNLISFRLFMRQSRSKLVQRFDWNWVLFAFGVTRSKLEKSEKKNSIRTLDQSKYSRLESFTYHRLRILGAAINKHPACRSSAYYNKCFRERCATMVPHSFLSAQSKSNRSPCFSVHFSKVQVARKKCSISVNNLLE